VPRAFGASSSDTRRTHRAWRPILEQGDEPSLFDVLTDRVLARERYRRRLRCTNCEIAVVYDQVAVNRHLHAFASSLESPWCSSPLHTFAGCTHARADPQLLSGVVSREVSGEATTVGRASSPMRMATMSFSHAMAGPDAGIEAIADDVGECAVDDDLERHIRVGARNLPRIGAISVLAAGRGTVRRSWPEGLVAKRIDGSTAA